MDSKIKMGLSILLATLLLFGCGDGSSKRKPSGSNNSIPINTEDTNKGTSKNTPSNSTKEGENTTKNPNNKPSGTGNDGASATQLDPNASTYAKQGESLMKQGKEEEAFEAWTRGLETKADDTNCLFCMGQYFWDNAEESQALEYFRKLYDAKPSDNLKKQVGRIFKRTAINDYDELTSLLNQMSSQKDKQKQIGELYRMKREFEAEAKNYERRDEMEMAAQLRMKAEEIDAQIKALENQ